VIKIAIIGAGKVAENFHIPAWKKIKNIEVVGIVDSNIIKAKKLAKKHSIKNTAENIDTLLKLIKVDAVDVCTSNFTHSQLILRCIKNKLHVLCEKPFVLNYKDIGKITQVSKKNKVVCLSAQHQRYRFPSIQLKNILNKNKLGKIYAIHIESLSSFSDAIQNINFYKRKNSGGGPLMDLGSHFIDLLLWLLKNKKVNSVAAFSSFALSKYLKKKKMINKESDIEDYSKGFIRFNDNLTVSFEFSYLLNSNIRKSQKITFHGTKQTLIWPDMTSKKIFKKNSYFKEKEKEKASILMLKNFTNLIMTKQYHNKDLKITKNTLKIIKLLYDSIKKGKEVKFENI